jgi:arylsulfatase A-like enzyme
VRAAPVVDRKAPFVFEVDAASLARGRHRVYASAENGTRTVRGTTDFDADTRPNIVFVMTDDMRFDEMDRVADLKPGGGFDWIRQHGTRFPKMWMTNNMCCPGRTTALTGQTSYSSKVFDNSKFVDLRQTLPRWLQKAGYCTGFTGKYLNGYRPRAPRPKGWTYLEPLVASMNDEHNYAMLGRDGEVVRPGTFITDQLTKTASAQLADCLDAKKPAFVAYWPFAPHFGSNPAPQYAATPVPWAPTDPSFNEADVSDKPEWLQQLYPEPRANVLNWYGRWAQVRAQTLLSVDDGIASLIKSLQARGALDHTIIVLTSDNGWFFGEHRIDNRKASAYDAGQVALWIAGPGFAPGAVDDAYVTNLDVVPTLLRASGAKAGASVDGRSIQSLLQAPDHGRDRFLPLYVPHDNGDSDEANATNEDPAGMTPTNPTGTGVRTWRYKYVKYSDGSDELYDLQTDPYELTNITADPEAGAIKRQMQHLMEQGERCHGDSCRVPAPRALR